MKLHQIQEAKYAFTDDTWYDDDEFLSKLSISEETYDDTLDGLTRWRGYNEEDWIRAMNQTLEKHNQNIRVTDVEQREKDTFHYKSWKIAVASNARVPKGTRTPVAKKASRRNF